MLKNAQPPLPQAPARLLPPGRYLREPSTYALRSPGQDQLRLFVPKGEDS